MVKNYFLALIFTCILTSCDAVGNALSFADRSMQVGNAYEQQARYIKAQSPYQNSANGTKIVYSYNHSTTRSLTWVNKMIENRGGYIYIYALKSGQKRLIHRMAKGYHDKYSNSVVVRNPYYGDLETMHFEIVSIPQNVFIYLKRGYGNVEDYSMR